MAKKIISFLLEAFKVCWKKWRKFWFQRGCSIKKYNPRTFWVKLPDGNLIKKRNRELKKYSKDY